MILTIALIEAILLVVAIRVAAECRALAKIYEFVAQDLQGRWSRLVDENHELRSQLGQDFFGRPVPAEKNISVN